MFVGNFTSLIDVVSEFEGLCISQEEYEAETCPYPNVEAWLEGKAELKEALSNEKYRMDEVVFAAYSCEYYEGDAFVLFIKDGKLYEVNGSHCSCYGLEGQWEPEETFVDAILKRLDNDYHEPFYKNELREVLIKLKG